MANNSSDSSNSSYGGPAGNLLGAGLGLALSGIEYRWNKKQQAKDEANRPKYEIPPEVYAGLSEAQRQALEGLPDAQKQQYVTNLQRGTAYGLSQIGSRKGGLAGLAALNEQQNQGYYSLLSADAAARMQKQQQIFSQLQNVADYKGQQFQLNQLNPYYEHIARSAANRGALMQNLNNYSQLAAQGVGQLTGGGGGGGKSMPSGGATYNPGIGGANAEGVNPEMFAGLV